MATSISAINQSPTRIQWMWKAGANPFSKTRLEEWKPYSDVENIIIEEAYQSGKKHAVLDNYSIDFKHRLQILNTDGNKQRPIKRTMCNRSDLLREERFTFTPINPEQPFGGLYGWISPFIKEVVKHLNITHEQLPSKDETVVPMVVGKAACGIIEEGKKIGKQREAEQIANTLREQKNAGIQKVWQCCAHLYSLESFLYKKLNETMRLIGSKQHEQEWRDKIHTLGPFCLLLWDNPSNYKTTERGAIFYRGGNLSQEQILLFKNDSSKSIYEKPMRSFPSFTSCSRNRSKAEKFGNVLFIMTVKHAFTVDLKPFSKYPDEEEELLSPGVCFTVDRLEKINKKHLIYLTLIQQYSRK
ncbi:hypothetical protein I4U23_005805 [Adineta vaga]|nr:hypothetical protein I4U23_005805 [Adineta vaga]